MGRRSLKEASKPSRSSNCPNKLQTFRPSGELAALLCKKVKKNGQKTQKIRKIRSPPPEFLKDVLKNRELIAAKLQKIKTCVMNPKPKISQKINALGKAIFLAIKSVSSEKFKRKVLNFVGEQQSCELREMMAKELKAKTAFFNSLDQDHDEEVPFELVKADRKKK